MPQNVTILEPVGIGYGTINAGELSNEEYEEVAAAASRNVVKVRPEAPSCCIDGRGCIECLDGTATEPRPSVAGGAAVTAYGAAELSGYFGDAGGTTSECIAEINSRLEAAGIPTGSHCDRVALESDFTDPESGAPKTGCGANDKLVTILEQPYEHEAEVTAITGLVMGQWYDASAMARVDRAVLQRRIAGWNPKDTISIISGKDAHGIEVLEGAHREVAVVFNFIEGTTIDRDAFIAETDKQIFVVDVWYLQKIAAALAGQDEALRTRMVHAMVSYQAATYLTLCDGSQRPIVIA